MIRTYLVELKVVLEINELSPRRAEARARGILVLQGFTPAPQAVVKRVDQIEVSDVREGENA